MSKTKIMGIINVTPDSFYGPSRAVDKQAAIEKAHSFVDAGADYIDIGGESTRPQAEKVSLDEELKRVIPVFKELSRTVKIPLSIDTMKPEVAKQAVEHGATLINDVSGFSNPLMRKVAADFQVDCCVMHMQGTPQTMQDRPCYERDVVVEVYDWLDKQTKIMIHEGIASERIIVDPGIGFGKTIEDNFSLIKSAAAFKKLGFRVLYGVSRKSFMRHFLNKGPEAVLAATVALNSFLIQAGVDIIRVHDVSEHRDARDLLSMIL